MTCVGAAAAGPPLSDLYRGLPQGTVGAGLPHARVAARSSRRKSGGPWQNRFGASKAAALRIEDGRDKNRAVVRRTWLGAGGSKGVSYRRNSELEGWGLEREAGGLPGGEATSDFADVGEMAQLQEARGN